MLNKRILPSCHYVLTILCIRLLYVKICRLVFASHEDGMSRSTPHFPHYPGWPTAQQIDEEDLHLKAHSKTVIISVIMCKLKHLANSRGSHPLRRYDDLGQHSPSDAQNLCQINLHILTTANKHIHTISSCCCKR